MRIESRSAPTHRVNAPQEPGLGRQEETFQAEVLEPVEESPALRAYLGESAFDPAVQELQGKAQASEGASGVDMSLYGDWAGERLQLGLLIAENLKHFSQG